MQLLDNTLQCGSTEMLIKKYIEIILTEIVAFEQKIKSYEAFDET